MAVDSIRLLPPVKTCASDSALDVAVGLAVAAVQCVVPAVGAVVPAVGFAVVFLVGSNNRSHPSHSASLCQKTGDSNDHLSNCNIGREIFKNRP